MNARNWKERFAERNTIEETTSILKISRATLYERIKAGLISVTKDGARTFITGAEIERYLAACEAPRAEVQP